MKQIVTKKRPKVTPVGYRRFKFCTGGYKESIIGKEVESNQPVWAEVRYDPKPVFKDDRKYYRLYTFVNY